MTEKTEESMAVVCPSCSAQAWFIIKVDTGTSEKGILSCDQCGLETDYEFYYG